MSILGVILAGGGSTRMGGGDKCLRRIGDRRILDYVRDSLGRQVGRMVLSANGDAARFADFGLPVLADRPGIVNGPLAGLLAVMEWNEAHGAGATHLVSVAADTPFFPSDLVDHLLAACGGSSSTIALATSDGRTHPVFGLWPVRLRADLVRWCGESEKHSVLGWAERHPLAKVPFPLRHLPDGRTLDPFFNINTPDDLALAASFVAASGE